MVRQKSFPKDSAAQNNLRATELNFRELELKQQAKRLFAFIFPTLNMDGQEKSTSGLMDNGQSPTALKNHPMMKTTRLRFVIPMQPVAYML